MRSFAGRWFRTRQWLDGGRLVEATRLWRFVFRVHVAGGGLVFDQIAAAVGIGELVMRVPRRLAPIIRGRVEPAGSGARVNIQVAAPIVGMLVAYDGVVTPLHEENR